MNGGKGYGLFWRKTCSCHWRDIAAWKTAGTKLGLLLGTAVMPELEAYANARFVINLPESGGAGLSRVLRSNGVLSRFGGQ